MGFSTTAAVAIIGVSLFICLEIFTSNVIPTISTYDDSYKTMINRKIDATQTQINITTVDVTAYGLNYNHSINITNTGSITLDTAQCVVLINGISQQFICTVDYIYPEKYALFNVSNLPGDGAKTAKVITINGIEDYYNYII